MLEGLNSAQREAVLHRGGPLVVFAGAGSGKTRVITHRVADLVASDGIAPYRILAVTFTNKAAGEMRERLFGLLGGEARDVWVGTFHATCARLLRRHAELAGVRPDFTIYDDGDQQALITRILKELGLDDRRISPKRVAAQIGRAKQEVVGPDAFSADDLEGEHVARIYALYEEKLARAGALDFDDLIFRLVRAIEARSELRDHIASRFSHLLVDEYQDTNHAQFRLLRALASDHRNLAVVGDDDQSIYRWRGADRRNILEFRRDFPDAHIVKLEQNYRSTQRILRVANAVISRNKEREPKTLWTENDEGAAVVVVGCEDERDEARMMARAVSELRQGGHRLTEIAVFYRIHAQSRVLEEELRAGNIPYRVVGGTRFYDRAEVKDVLAYLRVLHNRDDDVSLLRIINTPARGIGKTTVDRLLDAAARRGQGVYALLQDDAALAAIGAAGAQKKLAAFVSLVEELAALASNGTPLPELGRTLLDRTGYLSTLEREDSAEADARLQNLNELLGSMAELAEADPEQATLAAFLERVTLQTSADDLDADDRLTLMTVHGAKGLEFPVVFVVGLEEQMFPYRGVEPGEDPEELEEERRLAYVAFTRAEQRLILSHTRLRTLFGRMRIGEPSRFLLELPAEDVQVVGAPIRRPPPRAALSGLGSARPSKTSVPRDGSSYVDRSEGSDLYDAALHPGMRVRHPKFGVGRVRDLGDGLPPRVTVEFPDVGMKTIVATFLEPA